MKIKLRITTEKTTYITSITEDFKTEEQMITDLLDTVHYGAGKYFVFYNQGRLTSVPCIMLSNAIFEVINSENTKNEIDREIDRAKKSMEENLTQ